MNSLERAFEALQREWAKEETTLLSKKLKDIGILYLQAYPSPQHIGPIKEKSKQQQAQFLANLSSTVSEQLAYSYLITVLYTIPHQEALSKMLLGCISDHRLLPEHAYDGHQTYHSLIYDTYIKSHDESRFNQQVAEALLTIAAPSLNERFFSPLPSPTTLGEKLANISICHLKAPTRFLFFTPPHQLAARLLLSWHTFDDQTVWSLAQCLLQGLPKKSALAQKIRAIMPEKASAESSESYQGPTLVQAAALRNCFINPLYSASSEINNGETVGFSQ